MGKAILDGWLRSGIDPRTISVIRKNHEHDIISPIDGEKVRCYPNVQALETPPDVIIFAVKPQIMPSLLSDYRDIAQNALSISVAAGKTIAFFEHYLGSEAAIVRSMPNLPATICQGVTVATPNNNVNESQKILTKELLGVTGTFLWTEEESSMDGVTALSGSGPAYVFLFIEYLIDAGMKIGLNKELAEQLAFQTVKGSATLANDSELPVVELRHNVTSPGGTTEAGLKTMMNDNKMQDTFVFGPYEFQHFKCCGINRNRYRNNEIQ